MSTPLMIFTAFALLLTILGVWLATLYYRATPVQVVKPEIRLYSPEGEHHDATEFMDTQSLDAAK
jgi:hypothetical protein